MNVIHIGSKHWHQPNVVDCILYHVLAIETCWCLTVPITRNDILCHFYSYNVTSRKFESGSTKKQQNSVGRGCYLGRVDQDNVTQFCWFSQLIWSQKLLNFFLNYCSNFSDNKLFSIWLDFYGTLTLSPRMASGLELGTSHLTHTTLTNSSYLESNERKELFCLHIYDPLQTPHFRILFNIHPYFLPPHKHTYPKPLIIPS